MKKTKLTTKECVQISLFIALISVCSFWAFPIPFAPAPITMQTFAIFLVGLSLGKKSGSIAVFIYILMGLLGIPVFSGFGAGIGHLLGITGGFIIGFIPASFMIGYIKEILTKKLHIDMIISASISCIIGLLIIYFFGVVRFAMIANSNFISGFLLVALPYFPADLIKMLLAIFTHIAVEKYIAINA